MRNIKSFLENLSHHPGTYQMLGEGGDVLYVGKAKDLKKRVTSYFSGRVLDQKIATLIKHTVDINVTITHSENEAVLLECNLIKKYRPRYNVLLRDDKSYPYILITTYHPYPRIDLYRGPRRKNALYFGPFPSAYAVRDTINLLQKIFRIRTCRDTYFEARTRPCLLYQIARCTAPCVNFISEQDYAENVQLAILFLQGKSDMVIETLQKKMETASEKLEFEIAAAYRNQVKRLRQIQERQYVSLAHGHADVIGLAVQAGIVCIQLLSIREGHILGSRSYFPSVPAHSPIEEVLSAFITQHYFGHASHRENIPKEIIVSNELTDKTVLETALCEQRGQKVKILSPTRGEKTKWLEIATVSAKQSLATHLLNKTNVKERLGALQVALDLPQPPTRIECFDISHSMGEATVASCVVFDQNGPVKTDYRRFNITNITPGDDVAAMHQVINRRFKRLQKDAAKLPEIVFIDGGQTQLAAGNKAVKALGIEEVMLVGISKGQGRKPGYETLHFENQSPVSLPADSQALHLIQQIRDEAHRFAITGHRQRRDKTRNQSTLESIPGVGTKRRRELLRYFGGIQGLLRASLDELIKVPGISRSLAERIFTSLHDASI